VFNLSTSGFDPLRTVHFPAALVESCRNCIVMCSVAFYNSDVQHQELNRGKIYACGRYRAKGSL
jgi:hypothetical protein